MSTTNPLTGTMTPSELVLLNGDRFAAKGGLLDKYKLLGSDVEVSKKQLAATVYAAAFLALEEAGTLRLEIRPKKALFGLRTVQVLYADPLPVEIAWPASTLEARLHPLAATLQARKGQNEAQEIVYALLGRDENSPFDFALQIVHEGLAQRQLLEVVEQKKLKIFTTRHFVLPEATGILARQTVEQAAGLLAACQNGQPGIWKMLLQQIEQGIERRTKKDEPVTMSD